MKIHTIGGIKNINFKTMSGEMSDENKTSVITITPIDGVLSHSSDFFMPVGNDYDGIIDLSNTADNMVVFKFVGEGTIRLTDAEGNDINITIDR